MFREAGEISFFNMAYTFPRLTLRIFKQVMTSDLEFIEFT